MHVFEMFNAREEWPLTVFARDQAQADSMYAAWITTHRPTWPGNAMTVYSYEHLVFLREAGNGWDKCQPPGVGAWDVNAGRWHILQPAEANPTESWFNPGVGISYYRVTNGTEELMAFAASPGEAVSLYSEWYADAYGFENNVISLTTLSRWRLVSSLLGLRVAMEAGVTGVARWDVDGGWQIGRAEDGQVVPEHLR